jgi:uncharacterized protein (TIGR02145 family)
MILIKKTFYTCLLYVFLSTLLWGQTYQKGLFTDSRDGHTYSTVKIGDQVWLAQNLNYDTEKGSWTVPGDSAGMQFGRFYTWEAAKEAISAGWHLPSKQEFEKLAASLGVTDLPNWDDLYPLLIKGGSSGFNVQLTGSHMGGYGRRGQTASFWSSEEGWMSKLNPFSEHPWRLSVRAPNYINIGQGAESDYGFNVRCIRDE